MICMKYIQFKMLHRRIVTNKKLNDMGISDSSKCPYCDEPEETIEHAFITCRSVSEFWREVEQWLQTNIDGTIKISNLEKIMGTGNPGSVIDKSILATKKVIYRNRQQGKRYNKNEVFSVLKSQMIIEEYDSSLKGSDEDFFKNVGIDIRLFIRYMILYM